MSNSMITATVESVENNIIKVKALGNFYEPIAFFGCGNHNSPVKGERVIMVKIGGNTFCFGGGDNDISVNLNTGERRIFSVKDGAVAHDIHLGLESLNLSGEESYAVRYKELEVEFNKMKDTLNSLVASYNTHVHITTATPGASAVPGIISPTKNQAQQNNSNITKTKSKNVKLS